MSATISQCGQYRYRLDRDISLLDELVIAYFGVNPSTADAQNDDHTVRKWIGFAKKLRASKFIVGNAFAFRSTDVARLAKVSDPIGPENDEHLLGIIAEADILIPCWGSRTKLPRTLHERLDRTYALIEQSGKSVMVFGLTGSKDPMHPQMLPYTTTLMHLA